MRGDGAFVETVLPSASVCDCWAVSQWRSSQRGVDWRRMRRESGELTPKDCSVAAAVVDAAADVVVAVVAESEEMDRSDVLRVAELLRVTSGEEGTE